MSNYFTPDFLNFFIELAPNNNKDWFDINRTRYVQSVKEPFAQFVNDFIIEVQKMDPDIKTSAKDSIHRINRDIRFSKDKTLYKMHTSASLSPGGRKDMKSAGFYFELGPEKINVYGGSYVLETAELAGTRTYIAKNLRTFEALIADKKFAKRYGELLGEDAKRLPPELKAAADKQPLLYRKQFYVHAEAEPEIIPTKKIMKTMVDHYADMLPLLQFLRKAVK